MRNIGQCKCGNDIKIDDLVADGDGFLAYQCPNCMKIFYSHDKPRNVAKPDACPQLAEVTVAEKELIIAALNYLKNNTYSLRETGTVEDKVSPIIKKLMKD